MFHHHLAQIQSHYLVELYLNVTWNLWNAALSIVHTCNGEDEDGEALDVGIHFRNNFNLVLFYHYFAIMNAGGGSRGIRGDQDHAEELLNVDADSGAMKGTLRIAAVTVFLYCLSRSAQVLLHC